MVNRQAHLSTLTLTVVVTMGAAAMTVAETPPAPRSSVHQRPLAEPPRAPRSGPAPAGALRRHGAARWHGARVEPPAAATVPDQATPAGRN